MLVGRTFWLEFSCFEVVSLYVCFFLKSISQTFIDLLSVTNSRIKKKKNHTVCAFIFLIFYLSLIIIILRSIHVIAYVNNIFIAVSIVHLILFIWYTSWPQFAYPFTCWWAVGFCQVLLLQIKLLWILVQVFEWGYVTFFLW